MLKYTVTLIEYKSALSLEVWISISTGQMGKNSTMQALISVWNQSTFKHNT